MYFVWISEQRAIISLYSINWSVFITEAECLLRGTDWVFKSDSYSFVLKRLKKNNSSNCNAFNIAETKFPVAV